MTARRNMHIYKSPTWNVHEPK